MEKISIADQDLPKKALGARYYGAETYRESALATTADGSLSIGVWSYDGHLVSENPGVAHQAWLILEGSLTIWMDGDRMDASAGDLIVFEAPYSPKTIEATDGFRAVWIAAPQGVGSTPT